MGRHFYDGEEKRLAETRIKNTLDEKQLEVGRWKIIRVKIINNND